MSDNYVVYHLHSDLSSGVTNIDSVTKYHQYVDKAAELGMKALAFSEHGSAFKWFHKKQAIEKAGMKYIHAEEFYVTESRKDKIRDNYHCVLIAKNHAGFREINWLSSRSFNREDGHFYYVPRITLEELCNTSSNVIITTACIGGILAKSENESLKERFINFLNDNKDRCFLEVQHHMDEQQIEYNKYLIGLHQVTGIPLIAGTDTHALNDEHAEARLVLQKSKNVHFGNEDAWDLTFKSYEELITAYQKQGVLTEEQYLEAIENTNTMADMVEEFQIDTSPKYPKLYENSDEIFMKKIVEGVKWRGIDKLPQDERKVYLDRINAEVATYKHNGAVDFMLLEEDWKRAMRAKGVYTGYSRGSVSGSIVAYLLGITEIDSIKHKLNFSRFMSSERVSLPDIDTDIFSGDREVVRDYLYNKSGLYCCDIITFNTIALKGAIRDIARALEIPLNEVGSICWRAEDEKEAGKVRAEYPELFKYVDLVQGVIVSVGNHPAGVVVSPFPVEPAFGTFTSKSDNRPISQINMKEIDAQNYVKLDLLSLDNMGLINETCKMAGIERLTPNNTPMDDLDVWKSIRDDTTMIFQWESDSAAAYLKKLMSEETIAKIKQVNPNFSYMDLLSIGNGAIRPAGASYRTALANGEFRNCGHAALNKMMASTQGFMVFQEQIINFLHEFCGYTMGEADVVRRCMAEDTNILLANGETKRIQDIVVGDHILSVDEDGIIKPDVVSQVFDNGLQEVYEITTRGQYNIQGTADHRVLTQRGWIKIKDLTTNDFLMTPRKIMSEKDHLRPNQRLSSKEMFLMGMLIGDGTLHNGPVTFTNADEVLIDTFRECVRSRCKGDKDNIRFMIYEQKGTDVKKIFQIKIASGAQRDFLQNLIKKYQLNVQAADKHLPKAFMCYPTDEKLQSLLAGLFSTDGGYIQSSLAIEYYTISKQLAYDVKHLLLKFGIYSYVYSSQVSQYGYLCYKVRISQKEALNIFAQKILPFMKGKKVAQFATIIDKNNQKQYSFNYLLPNECKEEIFNSSIKYDVSINSITRDWYDDSDKNIGIHKNEFGITDVKAAKFVEALYCPYTYALLHRQYIPVRVTSIQSAGEKQVYDLEIATSHNYIANDLIVHNCFAKKTGTEAHIPNITNGFIRTMQEKYGVEKDEAEQLIGSFIQVIRDASDYLFSLNHSDPYSWIGYICGYLRYYYPYEFITTALNIFEDKQDKTIKIIQYAKKHGVRIEGIKFRYSQSQYVYNKDTHTIYKGMKSIKYMNNKIGRELGKLGGKQFNDFYELLNAIGTQTSVDARQLDILIKLDYFSEFGNPKQLLYQVKLYNKYINRKQFLKEEMSEREKKVVQNTSFTETEKLYKIEDPISIIRQLDNSADKNTTISDRMNWQNEYLGYIDIILPDCDPQVAYVIEVDSKYYNRVLNIYRLHSGEIQRVKVKGKVFESSPIKRGDLIQTISCNEEFRWRKTSDGFERTDETETILKKWRRVGE